jgi:hypothetical protein
MLNESINLARPLLSLRPAKTRIPPRYRQALERFEKQGFLRRWPISELGSLQEDNSDSKTLPTRVARARQQMVTRLLALTGNSRESPARIPADYSSVQSTTKKF